jgi:hypothetical protein
MGGFLGSIDRLIAAVDNASHAGVVKAGHLVEANAKASFGPEHSKGSPKSAQRVQSISGDLRRSIRITETFKDGGTIWKTRVAPSMIYGRRIELGFFGTVGASSVRQHERRTPSGGVTIVKAHDRAPYSVYQVPYPFLKPGLLKSEPSFNAIMRGAWAAALA